MTGCNMVVVRVGALPIGLGMVVHVGAFPGFDVLPVYDGRIIADGLARALSASRGGRYVVALRVRGSWLAVGAYLNGSIEYGVWDGLNGGVVTVGNVTVTDPRAMPVVKSAPVVKLGRVARFFAWLGW